MKANIITSLGIPFVLLLCILPGLQAQVLPPGYPHCIDEFTPKIGCPEKYPDGTFMDGNRPSPYDACSNQFFKCSNGVSYCYNCQIFPGGLTLYYDHSKLACDYRENIAACTGAPPTVPTNPTTTTKPPTPPSGFQCPADNGFFPINDGICSQDYYSCVSGSPYVLQCPTGSIFDPLFRICLNASMVSCNYQCEMKPDGFYPVPGYESNFCFSGFIHCIDKKAFPSGCPGTATFNPNFLYCVERPTYCDGGPTVTPVTTITTPTTATTTTTPKPGFICPPGSSGEYPYPGDCTRYYVCSNGNLATIATCPVGEIFNPSTQYCQKDPVPGC